MPYGGVGGAPRSVSRNSCSMKPGRWGSGSVARAATALLFTVLALMFFGFAIAVIVD